MINAMSAVDIALHDLAGKQLGKPIWQLLGGARQQGARPCVTVYPGDTRGKPTAEIMAMMSDMVEIARGQGFTAMKVPFVGFTEMPDRQVVDLLGAMRELVGDDITLGIDPGYLDPLARTLWVLNRLDEHRIFFAEAPLRHDDIGGYRQLAARSPLLIGAAEFATGRYEARSGWRRQRCAVALWRKSSPAHKSHAFQNVSSLGRC